MHHKRKRPKSTRAGCLLCKPHKRQGAKLNERSRGGNNVRLRATSDDLREEGLTGFD
jgi:hypothetical protein